ncbi:hypothetical protein Ahy_B08g091085 [Arachis hypogaea]|uniref:Uncharacterized protein n=1 Tax=Arachis hypogaea TaxID=3818 RepID=A0A444Y1E6_ARAHY|nr:hypothetical protein Ahy_B08g091085 [Arachis hypogaea]
MMSAFHDCCSITVAREDAWAKVSILELEINAAMRDLDFERRREVKRCQGKTYASVRNKFLFNMITGQFENYVRMNLETQQTFYSTTEEIQVLFAEQQEQLKAMQRTLEDEENYENTSIDMDGVIGGTPGREREVAGYHGKNAAKAGSTASTQKRNRDQEETSSNEASVTEKHNTHSDDAAARQNERQALRDMIGIVAPDLREKFGGSAYNCGEMKEKDGSSTDSDTQSCSNSGNKGRINSEGGAMSDEETQCCDHVEENEKHDDAMDEGDVEATKED